MTVTLARVQEKGGTYIDPKDSRLTEKYMDYVHFYPVRGGGKYYVDFNKAATVLPNDEIIWNRSEQKDSWYDFLAFLKSTTIIRPMLKEVYIHIREKEQKKHDSLFARVERNPHLAPRLKEAADRIEAMDKEWSKISKAMQAGAGVVEPSRKIEKVAE